MMSNHWARTSMTTAWLKSRQPGKMGYIRDCDSCVTEVLSQDLTRLHSDRIVLEGRRTCSVFSCELVRLLLVPQSLKSKSAMIGRLPKRDPERVVAGRGPKVPGPFLRANAAALTRMLRHIIISRSFSHRSTPKCCDELNCTDARNLPKTALCRPTEINFHPNRHGSRLPNASCRFKLALVTSGRPSRLITLQ